MTKEKLIAELKRRRTWFIACLLYIPMLFITIPSVVCACAIGSAKGQALFFAELCVAGRMLIGLALAEKNWKAWFYLFLPIGLTVLTNVFAGMAGH